MTKIVRPKTDPGVGAPASDPPSLESPASPESRKRPLVPPRAPSSAKTKNKVLLSVADGKIEWDKMTSESRKAFEEMFRDPEFLKEFGLTGKENFDPAQMKAIYDGMTMLYQSVCGFLLRWPPQALALLAYTEEQKSMLAGPTAKLADRFAPKLLRDNQELIIFFAIFGATTQKNFIAASATANKILAEKKGGPGSQPGPVRVPPPHPAPAPAKTADADLPLPNFNVPFSTEGLADASGSLG